MNLRCIFSRSLCYFTPCVNEKQVNFVKAWTPDHHNNNSCIIKKIKCEKRSIMFQKKKGEKDWGPWVIFHQYGTLIKKKFIQSLHLFLCFRVFHVFLNNIKYFSFSLSFPEVKNGDRQCDGRNTQFWVCRRKVSRLFLFFCAKWEKPYTCIMHGGFFVVYLEHLHNATDKKHVNVLHDSVTQCLSNKFLFFQWLLTLEKSFPLITYWLAIFLMRKQFFVSQLWAKLCNTSPLITITDPN